ncbi:MAG TPA: DNA-formamidopyrimidine glycosylase family protein [bacterium]|nr:DNA-formamidopyrimidine glycosylase family protein [bacterium]
MPELPELIVYRERLEEALAGRTVSDVRVLDPFVLRTVDPAPDAAKGRRILGASRRSKFLLLEVEGPLHFAFHLMLGGRLHLKPADGFKPHRRRTVFALTAGDTVLEMTEAGKRRKASLHVLADPGDLDRIERGVEPLSGELTVGRLGELLRATNRQLKGALRDPSLISGIGNAYSDEILFAARLSPLRLTRRLADEEIGRLHASLGETLTDWAQRVRAACPEGLPVKQDHWRRDMAVHGKTGEPCPACGTKVARISFRDSETNYCPECQNEGRKLADRRRSRLGIPGEE